MAHFTIVLLPEEDGSGFTVECPTMPGLVSFGTTREEAISQAVDAARGWLLTALDYGDALPHEGRAPELATIDVDLDALRAEHAAEKAGVPA